MSDQSYIYYFINYYNIKIKMSEQPSHNEDPSTKLLNMFKDNTVSSPLYFKYVKPEH